MDQMSALLLYQFPPNTSGAMFNGDPNIVVVKSSCDNSLANPKSATLIFPSCFRILANLKSLCMILFFTRVLKAFRIWQRYSTAFSSVKNFYLLSSAIKSPQLQYSSIRQKLLAVFLRSQSLMIFTLSHIFSTLISFSRSSENFP